MSAWTCRSIDGKAARKIVPPRPRIPYWKGLGADSEEKHEPVGDIDTVVVDSLKVLDPKWPIREADSSRTSGHVRFRANTGSEKPFSITSSAASSLLPPVFSFVGEVNFVARSSSPNIELLQHGRSTSRDLKRLRVCLSQRRIYLER